MSEVVTLPLAPVVVWLPFPPSVNRLWRAYEGKTLASKVYRAWQKQAALELMAQRPRKIRGAYDLSVVVDRPDRRLRDLDNSLKAVSDALAKAGVIENDHFAESIAIRWSTRAPGQGAKVWLTLEEAG